MNKVSHLLNMSISGIKNIEKEIRIDFSGRNVDKNFKPEKYNIKGIYGENGSGKTAIITAVSIVRDFIFDSNYLRSSHNQKLLQELINKENREFSFKCEFIINSDEFLIYEYAVRISFDENDEPFVSYESLGYKRNNSRNAQNTVFICENGEFIELSFDGSDRVMIEEKTRNLLIKQSALSLVFAILAGDNSIRVQKYVAYAMFFFAFISVHFDREDIHADYIKKNMINELTKGLSSDQLMEELLKTVPANGKRVPIAEYASYEKKVHQLESLIRLFKPELVSIDIDKTEDKDFYVCELLLNYGTYRVNREFESTGIKKIIELFNAFVKASYGFTVFIDEMDSNINDVYLCKIIEYFMYYGKGQLCFTSHNVDPMSILKENHKSIDFLTRDNRIIPWVRNGHYTPENSYRNGMIEGMPYNIDASDFIRIFEGGE